MLYADWTASVTIDICCSTAARVSFWRRRLDGVELERRDLRCSANASRIAVNVENSYELVPLGENKKFLEIRSKTCANRNLLIYYANVNVNVHIGQYTPYPL